MRNSTIKSLATATLAIVSAFGVNAEWGGLDNPGVLIDKADMYDVKTSAASDGSTYVVWTRGRVEKGYSLHAQLLDPQGNKMWGEDGILVDDHTTPSWYSNWNIVVTPTDELVISWADARSEEGTDVEKYLAQDPVLYKLDKAGEPVWGDQGIVLDPEKYRFPAMLFQVKDNIYARCYGKEDSDPTQLMLLDEFGEPAWKAAKNFSGQIIASEGEDFLAVYPTSDGVMAMRYNKDMRQRWKAPALVSEKHYGGYDLNPYLLRSDGKGGMAVCYLTQLGEFGHMPVVAYVTGSGETAFSEDVADTENYDHLYPVMNINPETETIMTIWQMNAGTTGLHLQAEQMDLFGERQWGPIGKSLAEKMSESGFSYGPVAVEPLEGGDWLVCYANEFAYEDYQMMLGRYDAEGNEVWLKEVGTRGSVNGPQVNMRGNLVEITWVEDHSYVDDEGGDVHVNTLRGVRVDYETASVQGIAADLDKAGDEYYSISGLRLSAPVKGLNIVRKSDGTVSKVMVK